MKTFSYTPRDGWSQRPPVELDSPQTLVLAFCAPGYYDERGPVDELSAAFPQSHVLGCSSAGEIFGAELRDESLSCAVMRFAETRLRRAFARVEGTAGSFAAGAAVAAQLAAPDLRGVFVLSDGHTVNGTALIRGLSAALPEELIVTGGLAADGNRFQRTWVIRDGDLRQGEVSAVGFYGDRIHIGHGSQGGWDIFGPERMITRSESNVLFELDGRPALELYKEYLGELAAGLPATALLFPLAVRTPGDERQTVRTVLGVDERNSSMTFAGDVPAGAMAQLMKANFDRLVQGAAHAALATRANTPEDVDVLAVAISCVGRRLVLNERTEEELEVTVETLPRRSHLVGFYSYGEISPYGDGRCELHNQTMTLTTFAEP
ncbi:MAG TPA: FIST N-terminal domain-containing protein [Thermoanaerobaculia bacterium]|nr:FIST N-terminal domain-containing protein [Thermoanaerobaculia bacterium]